MVEMKILGIDPGLSGGIAVLSPDGPWYEPMPTVAAKKGELLNLSALVRLLSGRDIDIAYLEMVSARPGQGVSSTFKFGRSYGAIEGILTGLKIPYQLVTPQAWTKVIHVGIEAADPKAKSQIAASRLFPSLDLRASVRCKKPHEGVVDALLIAEYGRRLNLNS
jgi:crossover junction endodeoxyribonuclease RuvC